MTRKEAKDLLPIMKAYAEGKTIQQRVQVGYEDEWVDANLPWIVIPSTYRIKPEQSTAHSKDMNENINLCEILKDCPKGTELWSDNYGKVKLINIGTEWDTPIEVELIDGSSYYYTEEGWCNKRLPANCMLWPSKDCRDWSKWKYLKPKFNPKTLKPFDRILQRDNISDKWQCGLFSFFNDPTLTHNLQFIVPYNEETKHLVGTTEEAPEYYRYWEDYINRECS